MTTTTTMDTSDQLVSGPAFKEVGLAVLYGGIAAGLLDATDGVVAFYLMYGLNPIQVLQFIASGAIGPKAFEGGLTTAGLGMFYHFVIAFAAAGVFAVAAYWFRALRDHWIVTGLFFGAFVWAFMNLLVVPNSAAQPPALTLPAVLNGVIGHAVFVGVAISYFTRHLANSTTRAN